MRRLRGLNITLSLGRISLARGSDARLVPVDDAYLIAEPARDGSLVVVFIHPPGVEDDVSAEQVLRQRLASGMRRQGLASWALRLAVLHCDAAAIDDGAAMLALLFDQPQRPLSPPRRPL